jgi:hypothetical protein
MAVGYEISQDYTSQYFGDAQWLRHYAARRKFAGSRPDEVDFLN